MYLIPDIIKTYFYRGYYLFHIRAAALWPFLGQVKVGVQAIVLYLHQRFFLNIAFVAYRLYFRLKKFSPRAPDTWQITNKLVPEHTSHGVQRSHKFSLTITRTKTVSIIFTISRTCNHQNIWFLSLLTQNLQETYIPKLRLPSKSPTLFCNEYCTLSFQNCCFCDDS